MNGNEKAAAIRKERGTCIESSPFFCYTVAVELLMYSRTVLVAGSCDFVCRAGEKKVYFKDAGLWLFAHHRA